MNTLDLRLVVHAPAGDLILDGDLDLSSSPLLQPLVDTALEKGCTCLTVDTAGLHFCDSTGLRALLQAQGCLVAAGGSMKLAHVHGMLRRVLDVTGLSKAFTTSP
ncbi:STAS domain-containing protein [Nonomuraea sp. NPDC050451]|uniref:STAS domain-containing protein n=1 Tax=Nonomuraea sp. NPDC050451 TaxID=3364364 RepID=UPI00378FD5D0